MAINYSTPPMTIEQLRHAITTLESKRRQYKRVGELLSSFSQAPAGAPPCLILLADEWMKIDYAQAAKIAGANLISLESECINIAMSIGVVHILPDLSES